MNFEVAGAGLCHPRRDTDQAAVPDRDDEQDLITISLAIENGKAAASVRMIRIMNGNLATLILRSISRSSQLSGTRT
jgi:hypothetical protein